MPGDKCMKLGSDLKLCFTNLLHINTLIEYYKFIICMSTLFAFRSLSLNSVFAKENEKEANFSVVSAGDCWMQKT